MVQEVRQTRDIASLLQCTLLTKLHKNSFDTEADWNFTSEKNPGAHDRQGG